jgi:pSer/pThr/pTyr-binding forkhead associated (FHA) protein
MEVDPVFERLDQMIRLTRLQALAQILELDRSERIAAMAGAINGLRPGAYLLGAGPTTVGIVPLTVEEVVLGRNATPGEKPAEAVVDYTVADTLFFCPQEASRVHAKVVRRRGSSGPEFAVFDLGSQLGTFVNSERIDQEGPGRILAHGDVLSLGPSQINSYVVWIVSSG